MANILVADDEPDVRELVRYALQKSHHDVAESATGNEALDHLRNKPVDLLVLDVMLPGMDGHTLQMHLAQDARLRELPVIVLTALTPAKTMFDKFPQVKDFMTKPFDPVELARKVERVLSLGRKGA